MKNVTFREMYVHITVLTHTWHQAWEYSRSMPAYEDLKCCDVGFGRADGG